MTHINKYAKRDCHGCQIDHESQREHTCLGITYNFAEYDIVDFYFEDVYTEKSNDILQSLQVALRYLPELIKVIYETKRSSIYQQVKAIYKNGTG